ncbi:hypothetical protein AM1_6115 [Acaryochloris marina MBIC11017]|uniref:Uncharacterized protein n=1 Tax=Acaryochloris marina (strain MBIC 11017) TaxID=329726 RepID=B0C3W0_ACAM1|nr:hypothetical protein AM1_6115 [Acaryochloris marina MBIC11017]
MYLQTMARFTNSILVLQILLSSTGALPKELVPIGDVI